MAIDFREGHVFGQLSLAHEAEPGLERLGDIPTSDELSGIEIRLSRVLIKDNGTPKVWPFPGLAQMYLLIIVVSDVSGPEQKLEVKGFAKVDDMEDLPIERTIFYWKKEEGSPKNPGQIHVFVSVIKSKESLRKAGELMGKIKDDKDYSGLMTNVGKLLSQANPVQNIADTLFSLAGVVGKYLGNVRDRPLLTWVQSFTDINGDLDLLGRKALRKENENALFTMTLIVRDKDREDKALAELSPEERELVLVGAQD